MLVIPADISAFLDDLTLPKGPIVVGVSGGADSLYLTYILSLWCKRNKRTLLAATVDHRLRSESTKEALWVHKQLEKHSIFHEILTWDGVKPPTHIEEKAREKRYELLLDFCHKHKATALFLAHHQQDQAETFWARLSRGSGLDGLCAIAPITMRSNTLIVRPLLHTPKTEILKALTKNHLKWVEDPMNDDSLYERVRWRKSQSQLDKMDLTSEVISKSIERLQRAKDALDFYTQIFIQKNVQKSPFGFIQIDQKHYASLPEDIRVRVLTHFLKVLSPNKKLVSMESVEQIAINLPKYATLAGCQWVISQHKIFLALELKHLKATPVQAYRATPWGNCVIYTNKSFIVEPSAPKPRIKGIPFLIQRTFPKIPEGYTLIAEKELAKNSKLDYKNNNSVVLIKFKEQKDRA